MPGVTPEADSVELAPISHSVVLDLPPREAFALFTAGLGEWWPLAYTFSEAAFAAAWVEPREGGRWAERDESGRELPWGEVGVYEEGRWLVLSFAIGADRRPAPAEQASEVEVRFLPAGQGRTRVELDPAWHQAVRKRLEAIGNARARVLLEAPPYGALAARLAGGFDLALIDGEARDEAAAVAVSLVRPGGYLYLDNADVPLDSHRRARDTLLAAGPAEWFTDFTPLQITVNTGVLVRRRPVG